jgi:hypothetical protein
MCNQAGHSTSDLLRMIRIIVELIVFVNKNYYYLDFGRKKTTGLVVVFGGLKLV